MLVVRSTVVGIYGLRRLQSGAVGSSTLKGSPRAWLLPEYHPKCSGGAFSEKSVTPNVQVTPKVTVLWTRNALSMNGLTINTVGIFDPPC